MRIVDDDRLMMELAGIVYRGFWRIGQGDRHARHIADGISRGLRDLKLGSWRVVWGPACFRPPLGRFDDQVIVVLHDSNSNPERFVVTIRGTNPISLSDWIFGDLLADPPIAWPFDANAHLTSSTAMGLAVLLSLGAEPRAAQSRIQSMLGGVDLEKAAANASSIRDKASGANFHRSRLRIAVKLLSALNRRGRIATWTTRMLRNEARTGSTMSGARKDLMGYLREVVASNAGKVEVVVTGHSKGGSLAAALTAWLAQTRSDGPQEQQWDPERKVRLRCFTFAGPTPGDEGFNNFLLRSIEPENFRRIWNRWDIVPHAFNSKDLEEIRNIYRAELIAPLLERLRATVERDGYSQIGTGLPFPEDATPPSPKFALLDAVDNHMDKYLEHFDIPHTAAWFFLGREPGFLVRSIFGLAGRRATRRNIKLP
jgi:hypothetical protein